MSDDYSQFYYQRGRGGAQECISVRQSSLNVFWSHVTKTEDCWIWSGSVQSKGYGRGKVGGRKFLAHRLAFTLLRGPVPAGFDLDHTCRNRACVNPAHLQPVTNRENRARGLLGAGMHRGEGNPRAKLTESDVAQIRQLCRERVPQRRIAQTFGVSQSLVTFINTGRNWRHSHG